ncbi:lytic murein transglycosylase [Phyllobacterium phragmitis]|uniref:Lytic murein transglycosylase n=1 Tax=Phyllobacterium phragmitis TaxID=2670329 RepID=A0A2S9IVF0_9HYPH|nr:lytic murein transglycosylase [Phyllobacterium phragmitis]
MERLALDTPLCLARHLPHKGGDWLTVLSAFILQRLRLVPHVDEGLISPLVGEMAGKPEGG